MRRPRVKVEPPRGERQTPEGDDRRALLRDTLRLQLARIITDPVGYRYRIAAVWIEELPKRPA